MDLVTFNIEGFIANGHTISHLTSQSTIISLQEHWLPNYKKDVIQESYPNLHAHTVCSDDVEFPENERRPNTRGGVATLWTGDLNPYARCMKEDSRRIIVTVFSIPNNPLCVVNCYLPSGTTSVAIEKYKDDIGALKELLTKYSESNEVVIMGDLNADIYSRNGIKEKILKNFIKDMDLVDLGEGVSSLPTYVNHDLGHSSHIDYVLLKKYDPKNTSNWSPLQILSSKHIEATNSSKHHPVKTRREMDISTQTSTIPTPTKPQSVRRIKWNWADAREDLFQRTLNRELKKFNFLFLSAEDAIRTLQGVIHTATCVAVDKLWTNNLNRDKPRKKRPWYPELRQAVAAAKEAYSVWHRQGRPKDDAVTFKNMKEAKRHVRTVQRTQDAIERRKFLDQVSTASENNDVLLHQLVRKQRKQGRMTDCLLIEENLVRDEEEIRHHWTDHFAKLATPSTEVSHQEEALIDCMRQISRHESISQEKILITPDTVRKAIKQLNCGKAMDPDNLTAEHLRLLSGQALETLAGIFTKIFEEGKVPPSLKRAYKLPIHKKGKDPLLMDCYRGISITSVFAKVLELICIEHGATDQFGEGGSHLQFGFTAGNTPTMASLVLTEAIAEAKVQKTPLFAASLDARKAFDVVQHSRLKSKLFNSSLRKPLWLLIDDFYTDGKECVLWKGVYGDNYTVKQGVRQGGILSTHLYKLYLNDLLESLRKSNIGMSIGPVYIGTPSCADDVLLLSTINQELQGMLGVSGSYSIVHGYEIHPVKSSVTPLHQPRKLSSIALENCQWTINGVPASTTQSFTHLGLEWIKGKTTPDIERHISSARATAYALLGVGLHGHDGLDAGAARDLIRAYITPRLLYGLEACVLTATQIQKLELYFRKLLRQVQSLPESTAKPAVYMLIGILPLEATLHIRVLSLFGAISRLSLQHSLRQLAIRQLALQETPGSWFLYAQEIALLYGINLANVIISPWPKETWKQYVKCIISEHWENKLLKTAQEATTLDWMILSQSPFWEPHALWTSCAGKTHQVKAASIRARLLLGRHYLQSAAWRVAQGHDSTCPLCSKEDETVVHHLVTCTALVPVRSRLIRDLSGVFRREHLRSPKSPEELTSAILNGNSYQCSRRSVKTTLGSQRARIISIDNPSSIRLANQLCNLLCFNLRTERDRLIKENALCSRK